MSNLTAALCLGIGVIVFGGLIWLTIASGRRVRKRYAEFLAYAASLGFRQIDPKQVPAQVRPLVNGRRLNLVLWRPADGRDVWFTWHHWTTTTSSGESTSTQSHNRIRIMTTVPVGYPLPVLTVEKRSGLGGWLSPVRGLGTGDETFDKTFLVKPSEQPAVLGLFGPRLRAAMLAGQLPVFGVANNMVWIEYVDQPHIASLLPRVQAVTALAAMLQERA